MGWNAVPILILLLPKLARVASAIRATFGVGVTFATPQIPNPLRLRGGGGFLLAQAAGQLAHQRVFLVEQRVHLCLRFGHGFARAAFHLHL